MRRKAFALCFMQCREMTLCYAQNSPEKFLQKRAEPRAMLRRQQSCRKLQRFWRAMYESQLTTHHLASGFIRTGIPRVAAPAAPGAPAAGPRSVAFSSPIPVPSKCTDGRPPLPVPEAEAAFTTEVAFTTARPMQSTFQGPQPPATPDSSPARQRPGLRRPAVQEPAIAVLGPRTTLINAPEVSYP